MRTGVLLILASAVVGCGSHRYYNVTPDAARAEREHALTAQTGSPSGSLGAYMQKVRELSAARPSARPPSATLEGSDQALAAALLESTLAPTPESLRLVAEQYRRLKVHDRAHLYLTKAMALAPKDWRTHDAIARLWRDSGFPQLGLGDAYRAVNFAPRSAAARNTLGTVFQAMGRRSDALREYEHAARLEPTAFYAHNNLCYSWVLEGEGRRAVQACRRALSLAPDSAMASNNAGLAYALVGDMNASRAAFAAAGSVASAHFNNGVVHMATREWDKASQAFMDALTADPGLHAAAVRARQAQSQKDGGMR